MIRWVALLKTGVVERGLIAGTDSSSVPQPACFQDYSSLEALPDPALCDLIWVDLQGGHPSDIEWLGRRFALHPLAIEDCLHADQRPKVEDYSGHLFVVIHSFEVARAAATGASRKVDLKKLREEALAAASEEQVRELHSFLLPHAVLTVHDGDIRVIDELIQKMALDRSLIPSSADLLLYRVLDGVVEAQPRYLELLDEAIEQLDQEVLVERRGERALERVHELQDRLNFVRRVLVPEGEVFEMLHEERYPQIRETSIPWFRDLLDHSVRVQTRIEVLRENLWTIRDAFLAIAAHRTNEAMRRLTVFSVIFLPLTFVTGFFGMNFSALPYDDVRLLWGLIAVVVLVPVGMMGWFSARKWL